jgi:hypothetical protein
MAARDAFQTSVRNGDIGRGFNLGRAEIENAADVVPVIFSLIK